MKEQSYHHGNLKQTLIETGIEMINRDGMNQLSLRKLAMECHVSHAAPYNHFQNKEELIQAIKDHITADFSTYLSECIHKYETSNQLLVELGVQYITYFLKHKQYYRFLFAYFNFHVIISERDIVCDDFSVFSLYRDTAINYMKQHNIPEAYHMYNVLATWAIVEGMTSIMVSDHTVCTIDQEQLIRTILTKNMKLANQ